MKNEHLNNCDRAMISFKFEGPAVRSDIPNWAKYKNQTERQKRLVGSQTHLHTKDPIYPAKILDLFDEASFVLVKTVVKDRVTDDGRQYHVLSFTFDPYNLASKTQKMSKTKRKRARNGLRQMLARVWHETRIRTLELRPEPLLSIMFQDSETTKQTPSGKANKWGLIEI